MKTFYIFFNSFKLLKKQRLTILFLLFLLPLLIKAQKPQWDNYENYLNSSYSSSKYNATVEKAYKTVASDKFDNKTKCTKALEYFFEAFEKGCDSPQLYKDAMLCYLKMSSSYLSAKIINEYIFKIDPSKNEKTIKDLYDIVMAYYYEGYHWGKLYYYHNLLQLISPDDKSTNEKIGNIFLNEVSQTTTNYMLYKETIPVGHLDYLNTKSFAISLDGKYMLVAYEKDITLYELCPENYCFSPHNLIKEYDNIDEFLNDKDYSDLPFLTSGIISPAEKPIDDRKKLKLMLLNHSLIKQDVKLSRDTIGLLVAYSLHDYFYENKAYTTPEKESINTLINNSGSYDSLMCDVLNTLYKSLYPRILKSVNDINFALFPNDSKYFIYDIDIDILTQNPDYQWQLIAESAFVHDSIEAHSAAVSYDKKFKLIGLKDGNIKLIDILTEKTVREFRQPKGPVVAVNISFDNKIVVSSSSKSIYLFDASNGELLKEFYFYTEPGKLYSEAAQLAVSKDNKFIFVSGSDGVSVFLIDAKNAAKEYYKKAGLSEDAINEKFK